MSSNGKSLGIMALILGMLGLALGAYGVFLSPDSTSSPEIVPNVHARAYRPNTYAVGLSESTIYYPEESYDPGNNFLDNNRYLVPITGSYLLISKITFSDANIGDVFYLRIKINNNISGEEIVEPARYGKITITIVRVKILNPGDNITMTIQFAGGSGSRTVYGDTDDDIFLSVEYLHG